MRWSFCTCFKAGSKLLWRVNWALATGWFFCIWHSSHSFRAQYSGSRNLGLGWNMSGFISAYQGCCASCQGDKLLLEGHKMLYFTPLLPSSWFKHILFRRKGLGMAYKAFALSSSLFQIQEQVSEIFWTLHVGASGNI